MPLARPSWTLNPGERIKRKALHDSLGGSRQSGISPSRESPNVFVFTDPGSGEQHGYFDRWDEDGTFRYSGEGQRGDQQLVKGNAAIRDHVAKGRALRVFRGAGGLVEYVGQFELDATHPFEEEQAPETGGGPMRKVIIFRLLPVGPVAGPSSGEANGVDVPIERRSTEHTHVLRPESLIDSVRRESELVAAFASWLRERGIYARRLKCIFPGGGNASALFSDIYIPQHDQIIEAKGLVTREAIRMAIGQLLDYRRFSPRPARLAVLVPRHPGPDLEALLTTIGISVIWRDHKGSFSDNAGGAFASPGPILKSSVDT